MSATSTSVIKDDELLIERLFDAPRELVYRVWTTPEHLSRWWAPKNFTSVSYDVDLRPGGAYRAGIRSPEGEVKWMSGTYREIVPQEKIVMTFRWEDGAFDVDNLVTVTFEDAPGGTALRFHQAPFKSVEARDGHVTGWTGLIDKLTAYLETVR